MTLESDYAIPKVQLFSFIVAISLITIRATPINAIKAIMMFLLVRIITINEIMTTIIIPIAESINSTY